MAYPNDEKAQLAAYENEMRLNADLDALLHRIAELERELAQQAARIAELEKV